MMKTRVLSVLCALALVVAGVPGRAVAAPPPVTATVTTPLFGNVQVTENADDDLRITIDIAGGEFDHRKLQEYVDSLDTDGRLLSDSIKLWFDPHRLDPPINPNTGPWIDFDGEISVTTAGLAITIERNWISTTISWWLRLIAQAIGVISGLAMRIACYAAFNVGAPFAAPICSGLGAFTGTMVYQAIVIFVDGQATDVREWAKALAFATVAAAGAVAWESGLNTFAKERMRPLFERFRASVLRMANDAKNWLYQRAHEALVWLSDRLGEFAEYISDAFRHAADTLFHPTDWPSTIRVMIVGDSMTQGHEGDYTWRYRLWQWFRDNNIAVDFVGPYSGTMPPARPAPPAPPALQGSPAPAAAPPRTNGAYASGVSFDSDHFAVWGRQAAQDKSLIRQMVAIYQPDLLLVGLGFNDMGWFVSGPQGTLDSVRTLVDEARAAKPGIDFALANVPQRTRIGGRDDLIANTTSYNALLANAVKSWSAGPSRVELVDWQKEYDCAPGGCPAGYDGLHPNALGEYQIARAFAATLHGRWGLGAGVPSPPPGSPGRLTPVPSGVQAVPSPTGIVVTWNAVFGAYGYDVRSRVVGNPTWSELRVGTNRFDTTWTVDGLQWEYQVRTNNGDTQRSAWSPVVSATAHPQTAPPPVGIVTRPTATGVDVSWSAPTGPHTATIDRYEVIVYDKDTPGAFVNGTGIRGLSAHIDGLIPGHRYVVAVATWNAVGGGLPGAARPVVIGGGGPAAPTGLRVVSTDPTTVQLSWTGSSRAAGYRVWIRNINGGGVSTADQTVVDGTTHGIAFLYPGTWNYEFCVTAVNGALESGKSNCVVAPRPAGS